MLYLYDRPSSDGKVKNILYIFSFARLLFVLTSSGMRDAKARRVMVGFRQAGGDAKPGQIAATEDDIARESRRRIVAPGLETAGVVAAWAWFL
jgi:hypothetical protein